MSVYRRINDLKGIIQSISKDKSEITISLPRGGTIKATNEGFEVGDKVCFFLNAAGNKIVKVIPKLVADVTAAVGEDPVLSSSIMERPNEEDEDFDEYKTDDPDETIIIEEEKDGCGDEITINTNERESPIELTICDGS